MKKIISLIVILITVVILTACESTEKIFILNVGDYIDESLLSEFEEYYEEQYNKPIKVVYTEMNSNEEIYQKLKNETYDLCFVSDYMIDRMYQEGMAKKVDYSKLDYQYDSLLEDAQYLIDTQCSSYKEYFIPYFWGTVGILYNTKENDRYDVEELEQEIFDKGLGIMFEDNIYNKGMYNSSRDAICMSMLSQGYLDINSPDEEIIREYGLLPLQEANYRAWGDDNLKTMVSSGSLDLALVYSGDYLDELYQCETDGDDTDFNYYAPDVTNIWIDGIVILENGKNLNNVYEFLNFFLTDENQARNADEIGYCPLIESVFDEIWEGEDYLYSECYDYDLFYPYKDTRIMYKYVSDKHYNLLNDLLEEAKSK